MQKRLDKLVRSATAKNRDDRLSSVKAMRDEIVSILEESDYLEQRAFAGRQKTQLALMAGFAGLLVLVLGIYLFNHYFLEKKPEPSPGPVVQQQTTFTILPRGAVDFDFESTNPTIVPQADAGGEMPESIFGSDVMVLRFIPGGEVTVAMEQADTPDRQKVERTMQVQGFYMDETKINNTLFVEFLHETDGLEVSEQAVWRDGQLWLLLGEAFEGYEPIIYRESDGKFRITPGTESNPVVQVTPLGALAYARYHGRDLPTMAQWTRALQAGRDEPPAPVTEPAEEPASHMHDMSQAGSLEASSMQSATTPPPNNLGIRGLGRNVNEWTIAITDEGAVEFHIHGGIGEEGHEKSYLIRRPWEAFSSVGFRTVLNLPPVEQ
jgi:serine/threonine-protein kinase